MSFFSAIGRFVSEFARFILFFASVIFLVISTLLLVASSHARNDLNPVQIEGIRTVLSIAVGFSIYLILLAIVGIFSSFFSSAGSIKLLAVMTVLNVSIGIAVMVNSSPRMDLVHKDLLQSLTVFQSHYDWDHKNSSNKEVKDATIVWDTIQTDLHCCGLDSKKDWYAYRPKGRETENVLPKSCCKRIEDTKTTNGYCNADKFETWTDGCSNNMEDAFTLIMDMFVFMICFNIVLGLLACIVLCCNPHSAPNYGQSSHY